MNNLSKSSDLNIIINEIIYLYLNKKYKIFLNKLNTKKDMGYKLLIEDFYKRIFSINVDLEKIFRDNGIKLSDAQKILIKRINNHHYINKQIKINFIISNLGLDYYDYRTFILSKLNNFILIIIIKRILVFDFNIRMVVNTYKNKLKNFITYKTPKKNYLLNTRSTFLLNRQQYNPQGKRLINRRQIFITDVVNDPLAISSSHFFVRSQYSITSCMAYLKQKKDPLYLTALELMANSEISYRNSYLYKYLKKMKGMKLGEILNLNKSNQYYQLSWEYKFLPWVDKNPKENILGGITDTSVIKMRFMKLRNTIKNINDFGYIPTKEDIIKGYFLINGNDYRFIVLQGWHRLAVLKAFNKINPNKFKYIPVSFDVFRSEFKFVMKENIQNWPAVKKGEISMVDATEIFNNYFI